MHTAATALETLDLLWSNYLTLDEQVNVGSMSQESLEYYIRHESPAQPLYIATWLARKGVFISAWCLWEYYARELCRRLPKKEKKSRNESTVQWIGRTLAVNGVAFDNLDWFTSANAARNLIVHSGARAERPEAERLLERSRIAFPDIQTHADEYIELTHSHVADLHLKIEYFIRGTSTV